MGFTSCLRLSPRPLERVLLAGLPAALLALAGPGIAGATPCGEDYGDVNGDGEVDVADVVCCAHTALAFMVSPFAAPACLPDGDVKRADLTGDGLATLADVVTVLQLALGQPLPPEIDANANGCHDAIERICGDGVCLTELGETCYNCAIDCEACEDSCCQAHDGAGCAEPAVEACVCEISSFCCEFFWDQSCAGVAIEFCDPQCGGAACPVQGSIGCGQTVFGTTVGGATNFDQYGCGPAAGGPERIFAFTALKDSGFEATVSSPEGIGFSVRVLDSSCDPSVCLAGGGVAAAVQTKANTTYYLTVDAPAGQQGSFELSLGCADDCVLDEICAGQQCGNVTCAGISFSCGTCAGGQSCSNGQCLDFVPHPQCPGTTGSCFVANSTPGCDDLVCCSQVCPQDAFCCTTSWDNLCAGTAASLCGGGGPGPGPGPGPGGCPGSGGCFVENFTPGCDDAACCATVCAIDTFCCEQTWDVFCAEEATFSCNGGGGGPGPNPGVACPSVGSCFAPKDTPGCDSLTCCTLVCGFDPFCCDMSWDSLCVEQAQSSCN